MSKRCDACKGCPACKELSEYEIRFYEGMRCFQCGKQDTSYMPGSLAHYDILLCRNCAHVIKEDKMKYASMFYKNEFTLLHLADSNINAWMEYHYVYKGGKCPTCNVGFFEMNPETNMYPHWKGECKE